MDNNLWFINQQNVQRHPFYHYYCKNYKKLIYHFIADSTLQGTYYCSQKNNSILAQNNPQKGTKSSLHDQHFSQENLSSHAYNKPSSFICSCTFKHNFLFILHHTKTISTAPVIDNTQHIIQCNRKLSVFNRLFLIKFEHFNVKHHLRKQCILVAPLLTVKNDTFIFFAIFLFLQTLLHKSLQSTAQLYPTSFYNLFGAHTPHSITSSWKLSHNFIKLPFSQRTQS